MPGLNCSKQSRPGRPRAGKTFLRPGTSHLDVRKSVRNFKQLSRGILGQCQCLNCYFVRLGLQLYDLDVLSYSVPNGLLVHALKKPPHCRDPVCAGSVSPGPGQWLSQTTTCLRQKCHGLHQLSSIGILCKLCA